MLSPVILSRSEGSGPRATLFGKFLPGSDALSLTLKIMRYGQILPHAQNDKLRTLS